MKSFLFSIISILFVMVSCGQNAVPVMGEGVSVFDVDVEELSGLCFNADATKLLSCGDQGVVKSISFTGEVEDILVQGADMEGLTYEEANNIEKILEDINLLLTRCAQAWYYSEDVFSGEV
jgi:hypothetical protein